MVDDAAVIHAVSGLARAVCRTDGVVRDDILRQLTMSAVSALPVAGAGVMLCEDKRLTFLHATSAETTELEYAQQTWQDGPCADAVASCATVIEQDLAAAPKRWPGFAPLAANLGLLSVAAIPLLARGLVRGVLDLYRPVPRGFTAEELRAAGVLVDVATSYVVLADDRDVAKLAQERLAHQALHDPLTGLPNRALLSDRLSHCLSTAHRHGTAVAVVFLDLDGFKGVNDTFGHSVGDALLAEVARRLSTVLRGEDTLARFGGDEFVLVCGNLPDAVTGPSDRTVRAITGRIRSAIADPVTVGGAEIPVSVSIGVAVSHPSREGSPPDPDSLLRDADAQMYRDKEHLRERAGR